MDSQPIFERERVIETLFSTAAGLGTEERASFLNQACGKDAALRNELESLLAVDTVDDRFIESVISDIGRYLEGRPILARKDTVVYRGQKFVQRHTIAVGMALSSQEDWSLE